MAENALKIRTFSQDVFSWIKCILFFGALIALVNWWLYRPIALSSPDPATLTRAARLVILGYDRIVSESDGQHVDRAAFRSQIEALRKNGYQGVRLSDVQEFFNNGRSLPAKSVLLTFDHAYLETYENAHSILEEFGWPAAVFVLTHRQEERNSSFLYWDRLQMMLSSGIWEVGTNGHRVSHSVESSLVEDLEMSLVAIARNLSMREALAYSFTQTDSRPGEADIHRAALASRLPMYIADDVIGINDRHSSPSSLSRIRVQPSWTGEHLIRRLERVAIAPPLHSGDRTDTTTMDLLWEGDGIWSGGALSITGERSAAVVVPGARLVEDWILSGELSVNGDQFWLEQTDKITGHQWMFGADRRELYVKARAAGEPSSSLAKKAISLQPNKTYPFRLIKRGPGVWVEWDEMPVFDRPVIHRFTSKALLRLVASTKSGKASITLRKPYFAEYPFIVRPITALPSTSEIQNLAEDAGRIAAISPMLYEWRSGTVEELPTDRDLFVILGDRYKWDVIPSIRILDADAIPDLNNLSSAGGALSNLDSLHFDLTSLSGDSQELWLNQLRRAAGHPDFRLKRLLVSTDQDAYLQLQNSNREQ